MQEPVFLQKRKEHLIMSGTQMRYSPFKPNLKTAEVFAWGDPEYNLFDQLNEKYRETHPEFERLSNYEKMVIRQQIHHEAIGLTPMNLIVDFVEDPQFDEFRAVENI
jgi:hypothetical protein